MPRLPNLPRRVLASEAALRVDAAHLAFGTTDDLEPLDGVIAQDRAVDAIDFALHVDHPHFNLFVSGPPGTGRSSLVPEMARRAAAAWPRPDDLCFVTDFRDADRPIALRLPAGTGRAVVDAVRDLIEALQRSIPAALTSRDYRGKRQTILEDAVDRRRVHLEKLAEKARAVGIGVDDNGDGLQLVPLSEDGTHMSPEDYHALDDKDRRAIDDGERGLRDDILEYLDEARKIETAAEEKLDALDEKTVSSVVRPAMEKLRRKLKPDPELRTFLDALGADVVDSLELFAPPELQPELPEPRPRRDDPAVRYAVNLVVDNAEVAGGPVVIEWNPTWANLMGRIERRMTMGAMETDHTLIRAGSLLRANGGVLVVPARELVTAPLVYPALKRALRERAVTIEDPDELALMAGFNAVTLRPRPVPLRVRVVLIGSLEDYEILREVDDDFDRLFKVRADFDVAATRTSDVQHDFARWAAARARAHGTPALTAGAVAGLLEIAARMAGRRDEVSLALMPLDDVIVEAGYWARRSSAEVIDREHIEAADRARRDRDGLFRQRALEAYQRGQLLLDVTGRRVGQVNALSVASVGDFDFGLVSRITAKTFAGSSGVVNVERETELSGQIHSKATLILQGYLGASYARETALAVSASITFEQNYAFVEGDSATLAEVIALLSSLSDIPVRQDIAITGSMSQHGEAQPVGGVNEKIEGFFDICSLFGLTGTQGVAMPARNLSDLTLAPRVTLAIEQGRFHVWAVDHVEEALELLLDTPAGRPRRDGGWTTNSVHAKVTARLRKMAEKERRDEG
jgi:lon-related putative ATP-dependent protease